MKKADLHIHSTASDGKFTPEQIVALAKVRGIYYIGITDHNTIDGIEKAIEEGEKLGVRVVPGVELSTRYKGKQVHLLGYFKGEKYKSEKFKRALTYIKRKKISNLKDLYGGDIKVYKGETRLRVEEGVKLLKRYGAKVVIAHPSKIKSNYFEEIINLNIVDGIEAIHPRNSMEARVYYKEVARRKGLFYTAGTDFHKLDNKDNKHGALGDLVIEIENLEKLFKFS